jgi:probable F420-dependent oxidoreductase
VKLGVQLPAQALLEGREAVLAVARRAEELGFDSLWAPDHVVFPVESRSTYAYGRGDAYRDDPPPAYDALVVLALAAGCTERVELATGVLVLPQRNPLLLAKQVASLDALAGGRVVLGVGTGWLAEEQAALGAPPFAARGAVTEEWIAILRACWSAERPSFAGRHYAFPPVHFRPRPVRPVPILVGGNSPAALRRAGRVGDGWFGTAVTLEEARAAIAAVRRHAEAAGRDAAALTLGCGYTILVGDEERDHPRHLVGTPAQIAARLRALREAGLDHLELRPAPMRDPTDHSLRRTLAQLERIAGEVRPLLD